MNRKLVKDVLFGAIGGVAGTLVIGQAKEVLSRFQSNHDKWIERELVKEPPTEALARRFDEKLDIGLDKDEREVTGEAIHWGYGIFWGAVYGILRDRYPVSSKAAGLPFGVAFGLFGGAILLPGFKLTPPATEFPVSTHARDLLSHCAYAATVEGVVTALEVVDRKVSSAKEPRRTRPELREVS